MHDILFRNARIVDGTGGPWFWGDVAVSNGIITAVLPRGAGGAAKNTLNLQGRILCPGFVDGHSHSELPLLCGQLTDCKVMQGVTTENLGLDGMSLAPIANKHKADWKRHLSGLAGNLDVPWTWNSFAEYLDALDAARPVLNVCSYAGLGTIRLHVMGMTDRPPAPEELEHMRLLVQQCMREGARGISAGLIYPPSRYQSLEEQTVLARAAAEMGGIYDVHMRNEADAIADSIDEVIELARRSGIAVMITHFKIRGKNNWGRAAELMAKIDTARADGLDITMAQYPYTAGSTFMHVVIPPWYHRNGVDALLHSLKEDRDSIKRDLNERMDWENFSQSVGWDKIFVSSVTKAQNEWCVGKSLTDIAAVRSIADPTGTVCCPVDAVCDLLVDEELAVGMISFGLCEEDITAIMRHPAVSFITDGLMSGRPHPRTYATYPRILGRYVREQAVLPLEEAVRKMTSLPARKIGLRRKGIIIPGMDADLVCFDEHTVLDINNYDNPRVHPKGVEHVAVNGVLVVESGALTGERPGRAIRDC